MKRSGEVNDPVYGSSAHEESAADLAKQTLGQYSLSFIFFSISLSFIIFDLRRRLPPV